MFIGGQAGRLLDVRQMKELFPRIVSGFAVGIPGRRAPRHPPPRPARVDGALAPGDHGRGTRLPRSPARDGAPVSGGTDVPDRGGPDGHAAAAAHALRLGHRALPPRLSGAVRDGIVGRRLPPLRPRRGSLQRGRADGVPLGVHGGAQPRRHPLPRAPRRSAHAALRPSARAAPQPRRRRRLLAVMLVVAAGREPRRSASSSSPASSASPTSRRPTERPGRRSTPPTRSSPSRSAWPCRPLSRASASRGDRVTGVLLLALNVLGLGTGGVIAFGLVLGVDLDGGGHRRVPVVHAVARGRDAATLTLAARARRRRGRRRGRAGAARLRRCA